MVKPVILLLMGPFIKFNCSRYQCSSERFSLTLNYMENWWDFQISSSHPWYSTHPSSRDRGLTCFQSMKIEFDIFNREFFRTLTFSLKFQKKAQVAIIYMNNIVFLLPSCTTGTRSVMGSFKINGSYCYSCRIYSFL